MIMKKLNTQIEIIHKVFNFDKDNFKMKISLLVFSMSLVTGLIPLLLSVLSTYTFIYHTCKNLLSSESIDSRIVSVDSHFSSDCSSLIT